MAFAAYDHWATFVEHMGGREKRNKTDFKSDLLAALTERGVRYKRRRWRDPEAGLKHGNGKPTRGFTGVKMKQGNGGLSLGRHFRCYPNSGHCRGSKATRMTRNGHCTLNARIASQSNSPAEQVLVKDLNAVWIAFPPRHPALMASVSPHTGAVPAGRNFQ